MKSSNETIARTLLIYLLWLLLTVLMAFAFWQIHTTLVVAAGAYLTSDLPKPAGWWGGTVSPISRFSVLVNGSLWLIGILWMENNLRYHARRGHLLARAGRFAGVGIGLILLSYGLLWLLA